MDQCHKLIQGFYDRPTQPPLVEFSFCGEDRHRPRIILFTTPHPIWDENTMCSACIHYWMDPTPERVALEGEQCKGVRPMDVGIQTPGKEVPPIVRNRNHWFTAERLAGEILSATSKPAACTTPIPFHHSPDVPSGPNSQGDTSPGFLTCSTTNIMSRLWKARISNEK